MTKNSDRIYSYDCLANHKDMNSIGKNTILYQNNKI